MESNLPMRVKFANHPVHKFLGRDDGSASPVLPAVETFNQLTRVVFVNKQGKARVSNDHFVMLAKANGCSERGLWSDSVRQDDHLSIPMILDGLSSTEGYCSFLSCKASLEAGCIDNRGRTCNVCGAGRR